MPPVQLNLTNSTFFSAMVTITRFLLLNLYLLAHVYAKEEPTSEDVKWLEAGRSVLVHLATPDLYFWNQRDQIATQCPGAFIFNFTLTPDNRTLLLNDEPILPRAHPYIPTPLRAHQTGETVTTFANRVSTNYSGAPVMDLDYYIDTPDTTSGTSIYNTKYNPRLRIDILRASIPASAGYTTSLSSDSQKQIWIYLEDLSAHPPHTLYSSIPLRVRHVKVDGRWQNIGSAGTTTYKTLKSLKTCHIWSWLCADMDKYPYYEYIYRENFDLYGKKGSMRHFLTTRWGNMVKLMGFGRATVLLAICGSMVLSPFVYAVFRGVKGVIKMYQDRIQEVDEWVADEEVEGLLKYDNYLEDFKDVEKKEVAEGKGGEKTSVKKSYPTPLPYISMKTEKSLIS